MEACAIATKFHSIALLTHPLNKSKLSVKPKTHLFCKSSVIILSKFTASPAHQTWPRSYAYANACSCSNNINSSAVQADTEVGHDRTVRVKLILQKECEFGEDFCVVGEEPILGSWDPQLAIPMTWSAGHIWTTPTMDIPLGRRIYFKFMLRDKVGEIHWQPGPDRVLVTWETRATLLVSQDWYDFDLQTITEAETEDQAIRETLGETEIEDQVVRTTQEEIAEIKAAFIERGEINEGIPVLVPGLTSVSYTAEDCSSTGEVPGFKTVLSADRDCLTKAVEYPEQSPLAISAGEEVEQQQQPQQQHQHQQPESSSYVENGSVTRNNHVSLSGEDEASTSGTTEISVVVEKEETSTSSAKELIENENTGASSESSCNEGEHSSTVKYESDSSVLQKDFDWGRAALSKLIWSLGFKDE